MDKLVELIGKILEKLTSAKLIWTIIIAVLIFGLIFLLVPAGQSAGKPFGLGCFANKAFPNCPAADWVGILMLIAVSLILSAIIVWAAGLIKNKYFVSS